MSYVVLARKWRPMRFEDLVGQDHVARTLGNAIDAGRVAHAFLFTGVRGVGKTTSARILAKALNCMREPGSLEEGAEDPGPTVTPCLKCPACLEIAEGRDVDVREIDGASYNGVDEVRKLQDSLPYRPNRDRFKVIIVDEVHMLTTAAWNAFLKTLEEPPPHVKFIFATTEAHKVPITILSRVQRFDFKMIPTRLIVERLRWVLSQEESSADDTALSILARQAAGSMRDAMSLLDQVIAFSGETLQGDDVARVLGVASRMALVDIGRALVKGRSEDCLLQVGALSDQGFDIPHVARDILGILRDLVVASVCASPDTLLDSADEERQEILAIAQAANENDLLRLHHAFSRDYDDVVRSSDPRAGLEMLLVRLALRPPLLPIDELLRRIGNLEKRLTGGGTGGQGSSSRRDSSVKTSSRSPRSLTSPGVRNNLNAQGITTDDPRPQPASPSTPTPEAEAPKRQETPTQNLAKVSSNSAPSKSPADPRPPAKTTATSASSPPTPQSEGSPRSPVESKKGGSTPTEASSSQTPLPDASYRLGPNERERLSEMAKIADRIREEHDDWGAYFEQCVPLVANRSLLELGLEKGHLFEKQLTSELAKTIFEEALKTEWGESAVLKITTGCSAALPEGSLSSERARERKRQHLAAIEEVKQHPRVQEALAIFDAKVKNVTIPNSTL